MQCIRCGNIDHSGPFPYCDSCEICSKCHGTSVDVAGNGHLCDVCKGKRFLVKTKTNESIREN